MQWVGLVLFGVLLGGCMGSPGVTPEFCQRQHAEEAADGPFVVCDELFAEAPHVRLPAATAERAHAVIEGSAFVTAAGASYPLPGVEVEEAEAARHAVTVYELTLSGQAVAGHRPALHVPEAFFLAPFLGKAAEGTISARAGEGGYDLEAGLPVRLTIAPALASQPWGEDGQELVFHISNLDQAVTASDGRCIPALTSHAEAGTFPAGADVELRGYRHPSMHGPGDDQFVILLRVDGEDRGSVMGREWYTGPMDLVLGTATPTEAYASMGHGAPGSIPELDVRLVASGGAPCTPA